MVVRHFLSKSSLMGVTARRDSRGLPRGFPDAESRDWARGIHFPSRDSAFGPKRGSVDRKGSSSADGVRIPHRGHHTLCYAHFTEAYGRIVREIAVSLLSWFSGTAYGMPQKALISSF